MTDDYTPTTATVRDVFIDGAEGEFIGEDFDRWCAAEKAKWQAEALRDAADVAQGEESGGSATGYGDYYAARLRDRADRIERGDS